MKIKNIFKRNKNSFKNNYGHVLVVAGSYNMPGAGVLCANSAIRSGAGLVTFAFPKQAYCVVSQNIKPEIMLLPIQTKNGIFDKTSNKKILDYIKKRNITSVVVGCGCNKTFNLKILVNKIIKIPNIYVVIDADAINSFEGVEQKSIVKEFKNAKAKIIVTPHPKEFERISGMKYDLKNRKNLTKTFAENNDIICVLKGNKTVVSDGKKVYVNNTGNPGMATAGSGDVLAGMISAIVCNKQENLLNKVSISVCLHGIAGDFASKYNTETSMISSDIIENIPKAFLKFRNSSD